MTNLPPWLWSVGGGTQPWLAQAWMGIRQQLDAARGQLILGLAVRGVGLARAVILDLLLQILGTLLNAFSLTEDGGCHADNEAGREQQDEEPMCFHNWNEMVGAEGFEPPTYSV